MGEGEKVLLQRLAGVSLALQRSPVSMALALSLKKPANLSGLWMLFQHSTNCTFSSLHRCSSNHKCMKTMLMIVFKALNCVEPARDSGAFIYTMLINQRGSLQYGRKNHFLIVLYGCWGANCLRGKISQLETKDLQLHIHHAKQRGQFPHLATRVNSNKCRIIIDTKAANS